MDEGAMSLPGPNDPDLGDKTDSAGAKLALDTLNTPRNQAKPFNHLAPPSRPALASDPKPIVSRGTNETVSSTSTTFSSLFNGANSGTSSAATSRSNSVNFEQLSLQELISIPSTRSRFSAWSTLTIDLPNDALSEPISPATNTGAVYALVLKTAKVGMYHGYVDICQKQMIRDKWYQGLWSILDPKNILEVPKNQLSDGHCQEVHARARALDLDKDLPAMPAPMQHAMQSADEIAPLDPPVSTPSSPEKPYIRSASALGLAKLSEYNASQVSLCSMTDSFYTARTAFTRSREHSVTSTLSAQFLTQQSTHNPAALMMPFDSIDSRIKPETGPALQGSRVQEYSNIAAGSNTFDVDEPTLIESTKTEGHTYAPLDQSSQAGTTSHEHFLKDIRLFHPKSMIARTAIVMLDSGSDRSFISPKTLKSLDILLDSDLIQPTSYEYGTLGGHVMARGKITLSWRIFNDHDGPSDHDETTFYISPDNVLYGALFGKDVLRGLNPLNGKPRMNTNFMNLTIPPTKEEKENTKKAREEHDRRVEENERVKKEKKAGASQQAASSSSKGSSNTPQQK